MKRKITLLLIITICASLFSCMPNLNKFVIEYAAPKAQISDGLASNEYFKAFLKKTNEFALFATASLSSSEGDNNNFCISPAAIYGSLAIAAECSSGQTRQEILSALGMSYEEIKEYTKYYYSLFNKEYTYVDGYGVEHVSAHETLALSLWLDSNAVYANSSVSSLSQNYNCDVYSISFEDGMAKKLINQYIEYKMHNIVKGDVGISSSSDFSIISLYHLKEIWNEFGRSLALTLESREFTNTDKSVVSKQLLKSSYTGGKVYNAGKYTSFYIETEHGYRLYFIVPNGVYSVSDVFTPYYISRELNRTDYGFIDEANEVLNYTRLLFPQMSVEFSGDISENLKNDFNITSLFDESECDFTNLLSSSAFCNNFIHKAKLNLDAKGIEGEAIDLGQSEKQEDNLPNYEKVYHEYEINRAFGFVLTDEDGLILYTGELNTLK